MVEKKCTKKAAACKKTAEKKTVEKKAAGKKVVEKAAAETTVEAEVKEEAVKRAYPIDAINVGFRAGDVYEALAQAKKALSVEELTESANISLEEVLLGMGWLLKEGKIKEEDGLVILA